MTKYEKDGKQLQTNFAEVVLWTMWVKVCAQKPKGNLHNQNNI